MKTEPLEQFRADGDWQEAWGVSEAGSAVLGCDVSTEYVPMNRIQAVIGCDRGQNDGPDWIALVWLDDGRFAFMSAGCDYTGWGCADWGYIMYSDTLERMLQYGLSGDAILRMSGP